MKVKFGMFITDGVNKVGGNVVSRNHYGRFARTLKVPHDPRTSPQLARRAIFQTFSLAWKAESAANQAAWIAATVNYPRTDSIGNIYYPSGQNLYIELNSNLNFVGSAVAHTPPVKVVPAAPPMFSLTVNETGTTYHFDFGIPYTDATVKVCMQATPPLSPGINYVSTMLRNLLQFTPAATSTVAFRTPYVAYFGAAPVGKKVFVRCYAVNINSGSLLAGAYVGAIVT
jgi:hypothetical protein